MVDRSVFDRRLAKLEECLRALRSIAGAHRDDYLQDAALRAQSERWLHVAVEASIDLAHHVIAERGWRTPATYREAFLILRDEGVLDPVLAEHMASWAGLRNILVHMYLEIDHARLFQALCDDLGQLETYAAALDRLRDS